MLISEDIEKLVKVYEPYMGTISEFVQEVSALLKDTGADELWVEEFDAEPPTQITALKKHRVVWKNETEAIPNFRQVLAFFHNKDVGMIQTPGYALGVKAGIKIASFDIDHMHQLAGILKSTDS